MPDCLEITAWTDEGEIMGVRHREHLLEGVQFHPESILTLEGKQLLKNFLEIGVEARSSVNRPGMRRAAHGHPDRDRRGDGAPRPRRSRDGSGGARDHGRRGDAGTDRRLARRAAG